MISPAHAGVPVPVLPRSNPAAPAQRGNGKPERGKVGAVASAASALAPSKVSMAPVSLDGPSIASAAVVEVAGAMTVDELEQTVLHAAAAQGEKGTYAEPAPVVAAADRPAIRPAGSGSHSLPSQHAPPQRPDPAAVHPAHVAIPAAPDALPPPQQPPPPQQQPQLQQQPVPLKMPPQQMLPAPLSAQPSIVGPPAMHVADAVIGFAPHPLPVHQATNAAGAAIIAQLAMGGQGAHMPAGPMEGMVHGGQSCMPCIPIAEQRPAPPGFHCFICKNVYRDPRLLNCLHTFCLDCLVEMKQPPRRWAHPPNERLRHANLHRRSCSDPCRPPERIKVPCFRAQPLPCGDGALRSPASLHCRPHGRSHASR